MPQYKWIVVFLALVASVTQTLCADSIVLSETWKDLSYSDDFGYISKDTGTLTASVTVPGLSAISNNDWSNLMVSVSMTPYQGSQFNSDTMSDAPNWGGTVTTKTASFIFQGFDTNFNFVNVEKITFTRSGDVLTIADQTLGPPAVQPPYSLLASYYAFENGPFTDTQTFDISFFDSLDSGSTLDVDINKVLSVAGTNTVTFDADDNEFVNIQVTATASFTAPTLAQISPVGSTVVTNALLADQVRATDTQGIANVELFWNGLDFGGGSLTGLNIWSQWFALTPGANTLATVATDVGGNISATNTVVVTYQNRQTNGNAIQFSEQYLDTAQPDLFGGTNFAFNQDAGVLNVALPVNGLQSMSAQTWSNLDLVIDFGELHFSNSLVKASILTPTNAVFSVTDFDYNDNVVPLEQLMISRSGNTLVLFKRTDNPTYMSYENSPIIAGLYYHTNGVFRNQEPFSIVLADGGSQAQYLNLAQTIYVAGTNSITFDSYGDQLDNIRLSGQADYTPPGVVIAAPTPGQLWSNSVFTVTGRATDDILVTNVFFSVNGSDWSPVSSGNNWTNWTATANLVAGTNSIAVYAVDHNGNISPTNTVSVVYILSAQLAVSQTGQGTITPNYNGSLLALGRNYSMTAKAATGFLFTGWTGSSSTNNATLLFTMASNLVFTANFLDTNRPTMTITSPVTGQLWSNSVFALAGKATDNVAVTNVFYSLNGAAWQPTGSANGWSNWTANINLAPGTNTILAYAIDSSSNVSTTNKATVVYIVSAPLIVNQTGQGTITPNYNGTLLPLGKNYSMTAKATNGFRFTGWTGSLSTNGVTLIFTMVSNLVFTANFTDTNIPTLSVTNLAANQHVSNAVFTVMGTAKDNFQVGGVTYQLNTSGWTNATSGNHWTNWSAALNLVPGTNQLQVYATDISGNNSLTNTLKFVYISSAQLLIQMTGLGTLTPNYSNAMLAVGQNYSISAKPATGFVFTNWFIATNGLGTFYTHSNVNFTMVSNLTMQVNFVDASNPIVTISSPTANQKMTNAIAVISGTAKDNWSVSNVWYQLNNGGWLSAPTTNHWTNWSRTVTLITGTNTLSVYATDIAGNHSATNTVKVVSGSTFLLSLALGGAPQPNGLALSLQLSTNLSGHLQYSSNLINWVTLTTFKATNSTLNFRDSGATNSPHRFYRVTVP